jgi:glycosyltransferase involved in cell wall biosynthesis
MKGFFLKNIVIFALKGPESCGVTGGTEVYIEQFSYALSDIGINITIYCGRDKGEDNLPSEETLRDGSDMIGYVKVKRFNSPFNFLPFSIFAMHRYYNKYAKNTTDYVIENQVAVPLFTPRYKNAICTIIHHLTGSDYIRKQGFIKGSIGVFLEKVVFPIYYKKQQILTVSDHTKSELVDYGFKYDNITVIPNIVHIEGQYNSNIKRTNTISYVGRYTGRGGNKRIDHVIEVLPDIIEKVPDVKLVIGGSMKALDELQQIIYDNSVDQYVDFRGYVTDEEKVDIIATSKVMASPSYQEGFGITYIEANKLGTPVVGYEIQDLDTVPETAGIMVPKDDKIALAQAIILLLTDTQKWKELSKGALDNAARFAEDKVIKQIQDYVIAQVNS